MQTINFNMQKPTPFMDFTKGDDGKWRLSSGYQNGYEYKIPKPHDVDFWKEKGVNI